MRIVTPQKSASLGILGKVKVGELAEGKDGGKPYPTSLDYFRFTSNEEMRVKRMQEMFSDKPTKIPITFHSDDTDSVCVQRYELRDSAGKLVAYGNGINFWESQKDGFVEKAQLTPEQGEKYMAALAASIKTKWQETLTLRFIVLQYPELGLWEFTTKGKDTSIGQIIAAFDTVMDMAKRVKGIPFWLTCEKHKSNRANTNRQYPVVNLVCDLSPEMVETVAAIGPGISGLITPEKLQNALPEGRMEAPKDDIEEIPFEEVGAKDDFAEELSKPVPEYEVTVIAELPDLDNLPDIDEPAPADPVQELKERFDLEAVPPDAKTVDPATWERMVKTVVLAGWEVEQVLNTDSAKSFHILKSEQQLLKQLAGIRAMMLGKEMNLEIAIQQDGLTEKEKAILTDFALKNGLE